jgi:hypothetical protein
MTTEEMARLEYAALMSRAQDAERMSFLCWMVAGVAAAALLAWGIGARQPSLMLPVVLVSAWGLLAMSRWREQGMLITGYLEAHHEAEGRAPAYFTRLGRLQGMAWDGAGREWNATVLLNAACVVAAVVAWTTASVGKHGELWAGVVTGGTLALMFWSVSEAARLQRTDAASLWRRADDGLHEVKRRASAR